MASEHFIIPYPKTKEGKKQWNSRYGLNAYYAGKHWSKRREDAEYWHRIVREQIRLQHVRTVPFDKPVEIHFYWNDKLDLSNHAVMAKMIEDAIKGILIRDDSRAYVAGICHHWHDKDVIGVGIKEI
jgi:hypothetical protein